MQYICNCKIYITRGLRTSRKCDIPPHIQDTGFFSSVSAHMRGLGSQICCNTTEFLQQYQRNTMQRQETERTTHKRPLQWNEASCWSTNKEWFNKQFIFSGNTGNYSSVRENMSLLTTLSTLNKIQTPGFFGESHDGSQWQNSSLNVWCRWG